MKKSEELALKHMLSHYVQDDDGFGGEDEPDKRAIAAINEALEWAAQQCETTALGCNPDCHAANAGIAGIIRAGKSESL